MTKPDIIALIKKENNKNRKKKPRPKFHERYNHKKLKFNPTLDSYSATLANPFGVHGVRIPDDVTHPSCVATLRFRTTVTAVQDGSTGKYAAGAIFSPTVTSPGGLINTYNSTTNTVTTNPWQWPDVSAMANMTRKFRVVSAGMGVVSTTAMAANQGRNMCCYFPGADTCQAIVFNSMIVQNVLNAEIAEDKPVNAETVCAIKWSPTDKSNTEYHGPNAQFGGTVGTVNYYNPGQLVWLADGISASASFELLFILNIEFIPVSNTISFLPVLPSFYSAEAMQRALNSPAVARTFTAIAPEDVMVSDMTNNLGVSAFLGQMISYFGTGATQVLSQASFKLGQALALGAVQQGVQAMRRPRPSVMGGILGRPLAVGNL